MKPKDTNGKRLATQQSVDQSVKTICDIMRRGNCAGALQYVPELTWILFLRILDERETREAQEAEALGIPFRPSLEAPYRWRDWGAPPETLPAGQTNQRAALEDAPQNTFFDFVNTDLLPHLHALKTLPDATPRQKVISEIMTGVERVRIDTERNFRDVLDKVHELTTEAINPTHVFTLSQVYEGLLLKMGEKGNDGGQFFTPRQIIKVMVRVIDPQVGESLYDPGCGTGGFMPRALNTCVTASATTPPVNNSKPSNNAPSGAGKKRTSSTPSPWPTSSSTASTNPTSGTATPSPARKSTAASSRARPPHLRRHPHQSPFRR